MNDDAEALANFEGVARLFPLPALVLFPHVIQPLHVFEPRYRQLTADALADDRLIALAVLRPGWDDRDDDSPPLHPIACLGRISAHRRLDDGRYILLLRGLCRLQIGDEQATDRLYRTAEAELLPDVAVLTTDESRQMRRRLQELVLARFDGPPVEMTQLRELFDGEESLAVVCDNLCYRLPLTLERKVELLSEADVCVRARALLAALESFAPRGIRHRWPPGFSEN